MNLAVHPEPPPLGEKSSAVDGVVRWARLLALAATARASGAAELAELEGELELVNGQLAHEPSLSLWWICAAFDLTQLEREVMQLLWAFHVAPELWQGAGELLPPGSSGGLSEVAVRALLKLERGPVLGSADMLRRWEIVQADRVELILDPRVAEFLQGLPSRDPVLGETLQMVEARPAFAGWPVEATASRVERILSTGAQCTVAVIGPNGRGRRTFVAALCARLGTKSLVVDCTSRDTEEIKQIHLRAQREARLVGWAPAFIVRGPSWAPGSAPIASPLQFLIIDAADSPALSSADIVVTLPPPNSAERRQLWQERALGAEHWEGDLITSLALFPLEPGEIAKIAKRAPETANEAAEFAREVTRSRLGDLGQRVPGTFTRADLVVSNALSERLDELVFEAKERSIFWENSSARRLYPRGRGLAALFTGLPGTGKTMAAQVVAAELGVDLFRIDIARSISKYIGETAKNMSRIFERAREMNAVVLFDEADALFSKRTEVKDSNDRWANTDTNHLLQLLEDFDGIAILSTNKREYLDAAFMRRFRYILEFERPGREERFSIWSRALDGLDDGRDRSWKPNLQRLADLVELSAAQIKLASLTAAFAARRESSEIKLEHVLAGVSRELAKEGRAIGPRERERIVHAV